MVVPLHILYPGAETERIWVEEVVQVTNDGGVPFFSCGFDPITNSYAHLNCQRTLND